MDDRGDITALIASHRDGDDEAYDEAVALLYGELRAIAHSRLGRQRGDATLQTTALVNEAYLRLKGSNSVATDRNHFLAVAATAMRHVVVDYVRARMAAKRGRDAVHVEYEDRDCPVDAQAHELLEIDDALRLMESRNERMARVFECKFFGGLDERETSAALGLSLRSVQRDWQKARIFLCEYLGVEPRDKGGRFAQ